MLNKKGLTFADGCTGIGGAVQGAINAGLTPIFGIDIDPQMAAIAELNFVYRIIKGDIKAVDWNKLKRPDWFHISPPCVRASRANNGKETQEDLDLADAICRAIAILKPSYFSLENVEGYFKFRSFQKIENLLSQLNYVLDLKVMDMASYGIPQNRSRLFLVASKDYSANGWWKRLKKQKTVSWYEAIEDLIPTLKETNLNGWQKTTMENNDYPIEFGLFKSFPILAIQRSGARGKGGIPNNTIRLANEPMFTIKSMAGNIRPNPRQVTLIVEGKVLEPNERCLARWQGFPDSYQFSGNFKLDTKGIGNAVPPSFFSQLIKAVLNVS